MRPAIRDGLVFAGAIALAGSTMLAGINPHDEGLMLEAAHRITAGDLPWRDFWWNYGPAEPLLLALPAKVLGPSLLWWRIIHVLIAGLTTLAAFRFVGRYAGTGWALAAAVAVAGALASPLIPNPNAPALALLLGACLAVGRRPVVAGAMAGLAFAFRPDFGLASIAGIVLAAGVAAPEQPTEPDRAPGRPPGGGPALTALGAAFAVAVLATLPFVVAAGPSAVWDQTAGFAFHDQGLQRLPFPLSYTGGLDPNPLLVFYAPLVLVVGFVLCAGVVAWTSWVARRGGRGVGDRVALPPTVPLIALGPPVVAGLAYLLARTDEFHLVLLAVPLAVLLAVTGWRAWSTGPRVGGVALAVVLGLIAVHGLDRQRVALLSGPDRDRIDFDVADGVRPPPPETRALEKTVRAIRDRVPAGQPIWVANPRHDIVRVGNPLVFVLADRPNPTGYHVMQPGVVTTAPVQRAIVGDLRAARPRVIVRWDSPPAVSREPNGSADSNGVTILDDYLRQAYRPVERHGDYELLVPR
ncbi:MAG: hypothetical protein ACR2NA_13910 [Solirubrobacterales bacterium]